MKIALLGKGKTGSKVVEICENRNDIELTVFDSTHLPTSSNLVGYDVILSFLTGEVFLEYLEIISRAGISVVTGSTGFDWTEERLEIIAQSNSPWIFSNNFSLGMTLVKQMIEVVAHAPKLFNEVDYKIHEVHHIKKVDAPSGTAKAWKEWLGQDSEMTFERSGDVVGLHELTLDTPFEKITLKHEALDRKIFAQGALWACEQIKDLAPGLHDFSQVAKAKLIADI
jgi:4-hydroxy-tetrahydrodipicolinate reductase